jgi:hypothetical protein
MKLVITKSEIAASKLLHEILKDVLVGFGYKPKTNWELLISRGTIYKDGVVTIKVTLTGDLSIDVNEEAIVDWLVIYSEYILAIRCPLQSMILSVKQLVEVSTKFGTDIQPKITELENKYSAKVSLRALTVFANEANNTILKNAALDILEKSGITSVSSEEVFDTIKITRVQLVEACDSSYNYGCSYSEKHATAVGAFDSIYKQVTTN